MMPVLQEWVTISRSCRSASWAMRRAFGDSAGAGDIGLDDVDSAALDQIAEAPAGGILLAGGNAGFDGVRES